MPETLSMPLTAERESVDTPAASEWKRPKNNKYFILFNFFNNWDFSVWNSVATKFDDF